LVRGNAEGTGFASTGARMNLRTFASTVVGVALAAAAGAGCGNSGPPSLQTAFEQVVRTDQPRIVEISSPDSIGSGVVFDNHGDIVTNAHVVGTATRFEVTQTAGTAPLPARLVGISPSHDLAVIRVTSHASDLQPVTWADSAKAQVGEWVMAMGTPYGLADTVTQGIVSATSRAVEETPETGAKTVVLSHTIQTSADINPGNSGGGLVDLNGDVVGIPTLELTDPQLGGPAAGIGFAIPSNTVVSVARQLIAAR
jgi:putative serine protease PepD